MGSKHHSFIMKGKLGKVSLPNRTFKKSKNQSFHAKNEKKKEKSTYISIKCLALFDSNILQSSFNFVLINENKVRERFYVLMRDCHSRMVSILVKINKVKTGETFMIDGS